MPYPTLAELRAWANITDQGDDHVLTQKLDGAVREVEGYCGRRFVPDQVATPRLFWGTEGRTCNRRVLFLGPGNDIWTADDLAVDIDTAKTGTYSTGWTVASEVVLEPLNGVGLDGSTGWPYTRIVGVGTRYWPALSYPLSVPAIRITAKWGWASTPAPVFDAVLLVAAESWKLKEAPFGVAGFGDFGLVRVRDNPVVARKLAPYVHPELGALLA